MPRLPFVRAGQRNATLRRRFGPSLVVIAFVAAGLLPGLQGPSFAQPVVISIGAVQGQVPQTPACRLSRSPFAPPAGNGPGATEVRIQGVIYERTLARTSTGESQHAFFIQNTSATADGDPRTSDGIFVFLGSLATMPRDDVPGRYTPTDGDEIVLRGRVAEFFFLTQLSGPRLVQVVRSKVDLDAAVPAFDMTPPDDTLAADCYLESVESMRARVPEGSVVVGRRHVPPGTVDGEVWVIRGDHPVALRSDAFARRVFRDPHPADNVADQLFDDGNGYRILLGSLGIKAATDDNRAVIAPARTYDRLAAAAVGGVYFAFNKYSVQTGQQITLVSGPDPSMNAPLRAYNRALEYSVVTFNVENLYDFRDDPFDGCDFAGNPGCPGVNPPFDYVPASDAVYRRKLEELALQIRHDLLDPEIIMVQEVEDQDICEITARALACGTTDNADGKPDALQDLALAILRLGGPRYEAATDRDGADDRGITSAYLYRAERVEQLAPDGADPVLGVRPRVEYRAPGVPFNTQAQNPKALNAVLPSDVDPCTGIDGTNVFTRAPQVAAFRVWRGRIGSSAFTPLYIVNNHFSSGPDTRVGQRREQAAYNAAIVAALQGRNQAVRVIVGGDLNVFPRPDDPFAPGHPLFPSDQLAALYARGLTNLWSRLVGLRTVSAYSYVFDGQTQTLDSLFVTPTQLATVTRVWASHVNSDWPADHDGDGPRGASDHDPQGARFRVLTLDSVLELLGYLHARGAIIGPKTPGILSSHLRRARESGARGEPAEYRGHLQTFINQVEGFAPLFIRPAAADALKREVSRLLELGP